MATTQQILADVIRERDEARAEAATLRAALQAAERDRDYWYQKWAALSADTEEAAP